MLVFDVTSSASYLKLADHYTRVNRIIGLATTPCVLVGTKIDLPDVEVKDVTFHKRKNLPYFPTSIKTSFNVELAFVWLMRKLTGREDLQLIDGDPAVNE